MTRGNWSTRFDPNNVAALCYGCHSYLDRNPYEKTAWFESILGKGLADLIREKSKQPAYGIKKLKKEITKHYRVQYEAMKILRANGITGRIEVQGYV